MPSPAVCRRAQLTAAWALLMLLVGLFVPYPPHEGVFYRGIKGPILAIELAHNQAEVAQVASSADAIRFIRVNTTLDLVFIVLYVSYLIALGGNTTVRIIAVAAGLSDYLENALIFTAVSGGASAVWIPSLGKWGLIALALLVIARSRPRPLAFAHLVTGLLILFGVVTGEWFGYAPIAWGMIAFSLTVLYNALAPYIHRVIP